MAKNQVAARLQALRRLERRRARLMESLLVSTPLVRGSVTHTHQRCGTPGCRCATKPSHPVWRLATSRDGLKRCQLIRQADVEEVRELVARYRDFRDGLRELEAMHKEEKELLRGLMEIRDVGYV